MPDAADVEAQKVHGGAKHGMTLPFQPLIVTFRDVRYFVPIPEVGKSPCPPIKYSESWCPLTLHCCQANCCEHDAGLSCSCTRLYSWSQMTDDVVYTGTCPGCVECSACDKMLVCNRETAVVNI